MRIIITTLCILSALAAALQPTPPLGRRLLSSAHRTRCQLVAQDGWIAGVDEASGATYYYNELTGVSQWEAPQGATSQAYGAQLLYRFVPVAGVFGEYVVRAGEEQVLGRFDMLEEKNTVSRMQCIVQVGADGTATISSLGKRPTGLRRRHGAPWYGLSREATHVLLDGEEIALDMDSGESFGYQGKPYTAVFTCHVEQAGFPQQGAEPWRYEHGAYEQQTQQQGGGYPGHDPSSGYHHQQQGGYQY